MIDLPLTSLDAVVERLFRLLSDGEMLLCFELNALSFDGDFDLFFELECFDDFLQYLVQLQLQPQPLSSRLDERRKTSRFFECDFFFRSWLKRCALYSELVDRDREFRRRKLLKKDDF